MVTLSELHEEYNQFFDSVVIMYGFYLVWLQDIIEGVDDFYYEVVKENGELHFYSCAGHCIPLKGRLPEADYKVIEDCFLLNKDYLK